MADAAGELEPALAEWLGGPVTDLRRLSGGASRETWSLKLNGDTPLILQRERGGSARTGGGMPVEAKLLPAAAAAGVPVAPLIAADPEGERLGLPAMVLGFIEGETIARRILRDDQFAGARERLTQQCAEALAGIHALDPAPLGPGDPPDQLAQFRELADQLEIVSPAFELGFRWLESNRPPSDQTGVVHGDFRLGNLIIDGSGLRAVVDWELAHLGDPMEDLGWLCVKAWRFGATPPVAGVGQYDELLDAYATATGRDIDRDALRWWEALGTLKWGIMCVIQASSHLLGISRSVELAAIGRRVCENEHDLLLLLP